MDMAHTDEDYNQSWEKFLTGFTKLDRRIELMQELKKNVKACKKNIHQPDCVFNTKEEQGEFYTTKHYYGGIKIQKITREFLAYLKSEGAQRTFGESQNQNAGVQGKPSSIKASSN